jgi:hypothetical protein
MPRVRVVAPEDLSPERAWIIYPGRQRHTVHERVEVLPVSDMTGRLAALR